MSVITFVCAGQMNSAITFPAFENGHEVRLVGSPLDRDIIDGLKKDNFHITLKRTLHDGIKYYQIEELEAAQLRVGEQAELTERRDEIRNSERIVRGVGEAVTLLQGDEDNGGAITAVSVAAESLEQAARYAPSLSNVAEHVRDAEYALTDAAAEISDYLDNAMFDANELDEIESRLEVIYRLSLKYGETEEEMLSFLDRARAELSDIEFSDEKKELLLQQYEQKKKEAVSSVDYNDFVGRIGIGRIQNGVAKVGEEVVVCDWHNPDLKMRGRLTKLYDFQANGRQPCDNITAGDIVAFSGLPDVTIGNTLCSPSNVEPLPFVKINDPTVEMTFSVNDSPLAGREGKFVTSRQIRDRLQKELLKDVALKVEDSATTDSFRVMGRGEMHLSILIETMRREGYELQVSPPHVLTKVIDGKTYEPMEHVVIDVPTQYQGAVMTGLGQRKAILQQMESLGSDRVRLEFRMPSRGLFGYRNQFLTDTHGEGIINQIFDGYDVWAGMIANRSTGSLVSFETGEAVTYGLFNAQQRGTLLVGPGEKVYEGMVIGYTASGEDVDVNVCKTKHLTNTRSSGSDDALRLIPISKLSLEGCLEFLAQDELLEVTPENLRIRKQILNHDQRMKAKSKLK